MDDAVFLDDLEHSLSQLRLKLNSHIKSLRSIKNYKTQDLGQAKALRDNLNRTINIIRTRPMTINDENISAAFKLETETKEYLKISIF